VVIAAFALVGASAATAFGVTITAPTQNPFTVPQNAVTGKPDYFTVTASGLPNGNAFVQECDGTDPSSSGWSANDHCDFATGGTPWNVTNNTATSGPPNGTALFDATDSTYRLRAPQLRGESPQSKFNCLGPDDPPLNPTNGLQDFRNCQIRVSSGTASDTTAQAFFTIVLPDDFADTTTTSTSPSTTSSTSTSTSTTTTTTPPPTNPTCTMGAGLTQPAPKPPKNIGTVKISKGLMNTPAAKDTKFTLSGTLENCQNFPTVPKQAGPIDSGSIKLSVEVASGSTCSGITGGFPVKSTLQLTFNAADPAHPGKFKKVSSEKTTLANYDEAQSNPVIVFGATSQAFGPKAKTPGFSTQHAEISFNIDQLPASLTAPCADVKKGLQSLNFTGVNGPSTLTITL
jgi:hypothetical protein